MNGTLPWNPDIPTIPAVPSGEQRPRWSVMIPTYNCARFLVQTIESALAALPDQDAQIVVVDDCSTKDDPEDVVRRVGASRVTFTRNPRNLGATATFNRCLTLARGHYVHILHGDDAVLPSFYAKVGAHLDANPDAGACGCRVVQMDANGRWIDLPGVLTEDMTSAQSLFKRNTLTAPTVVMRRDVLVKTGGFRVELIHSADWDLWKRIALISKIIGLDEPLFLYRVHAGQDTAKLILTAANIRDAARAIELSRTYTDDVELLETLPVARDLLAQDALKSAARLTLLGKYRGGLAQLRAAQELSALPVVAFRVLQNFGKKGLARVRPG